METKTSILTCEVHEHSLAKEGVGRYCVIKMKLFDGKEHYAESTAIHAEYIMTSRYPSELLEAVVVALKARFLTNFNNHAAIDDRVVISDVKDRVEKLWKPGS